MRRWWPISSRKKRFARSSRRSKSAVGANICSKCQSLHEVRLATEAAEEFFPWLLGGKNRVFVRRVGADEGKIFVAEPLDLLYLGFICFRIEVFGIVGNPLLAAAIERLVAAVL